MNAREDWPLASEAPEWWRTWDADKWAAMTPESLEAMREEYERAEIADAQSAADYAANKRSAK